AGNQGQRRKRHRSGQAAATAQGLKGGVDERGDRGDQSHMGRTENGICLREITYEPLPSQMDFHRSDAAFKGFSGPVGSGKSQALCQEALRLAYINVGRWGLIGAPTYPMLKDVTQPAFFEILEANSIPYEFNKGDNLLTVRD